MVSFCNPGVLGSPSKFRKHFEAPILAGREPGQRQLSTALRMLPPHPTHHPPPPHTLYTIRTPACLPACLPARLPACLQTLARRRPRCARSAPQSSAPSSTTSSCVSAVDWKRLATE